MLTRGSRRAGRAAGARLLARLASALTAAVTVCSLYAASASAIVVRLPSGASISYQPALGSRGAARSGPNAYGFDQALRNLDYNGGPVMPANTNYAVYWSPKGLAEYPSDYEPGLTRFFKDLEHDSGRSTNVDSISSQYNDAAGEFANYNSKFGESLVDTDPYPANGCTRAAICLSDAQIRAELVKFVKAHGLPTDLTTEYFLLTPKGVASCFDSAGQQCSANVENEQFAVYCAYHSNAPLEAGAELIYSNDPFANKNVFCDEPANHPNGSSDSALIGGLSHEHNESITDPLPNTAWTDFASGEETGYEIGDKCAREYGAPIGKAGNGASYNQLINEHQYWYQQEWSNKGHACMQQLAFTASELPTATFTAEDAGGGEVKVGATGSTVGEGVRYDWQFNDESFPLETESLSATHSFAGGGTHTIALTVFGPNGASSGAARVVGVKRSQQIFFVSGPSSAPVVGGPPYAVEVLSTSGLPVTLKIDASSASACTISGNVVSFTGVGVCTIDARQPGNAQFAAAALVRQSLSVGQVQPPPPPGSAFIALGVGVNPKTGAITFAEQVWSPGTFSWSFTFQNGKFGAYAARVRCTAGFANLKGRCRPRRVVFASGSQLVAAKGLVTFTVAPTASALKALKYALKHKGGVPVAGTITYQASPGGIPVSQSQSMTVKLKK